MIMFLKNYCFPGKFLEKILEKTLEKTLFFLVGLQSHN
jgi:hypothetical protein